MTMPPNTSELAPSLSQLKVSIGGIQKLCRATMAVCQGVSLS